MAKGKLTDDEIRLILSVDASGAQKSIHELGKANKVLEQSNKDLRKEMTKLELQGKKNSDEYRNAEKVLKENSRQLAINREKIREHEKTLGLENMTMKQLQKRAQDLQRQLDNTAKSLQPDAWNELNNELSETRNRMNELRQGTQEVDSVLGDLIKNKGAFATFLGNLYTEAVKLGAQFLDGIKDFVAEGVEMARVAEGVERAFAKLDDPNLLDNLRIATRGTIDDLTLMQLAVQAKNFKIPLDNLATYLKFAQQRAQETGESVDYLVNSIITGIGRKSPLILDNLGISAAELSEKMKETGDFAKAAGAIIEQELAKQGDLMDTSAEKAAARAAQLKNYQLELGKAIKSVYDFFGEQLNRVLLSIINGFVKFKNVIVSLTAAVVTYVAVTKTKVAAQILVDFWNKKILTSSIALTIKEKLHTAAVTASTLATYAKALAHDVLAKKITIAYAAQEALRIAFMKTPWGLVLAAVAAIGVAIYNAAQKTKELTAEQQSLKNIAQKTTEQFSEQKAKIDILIKDIENENLANEVRKKRINELREIMPGYNGLLDEEGKLINHNSEAIKEYLQLLQKKIELQATEDMRLDIAKKRNEAQMKYNEANNYIESNSSQDEKSFLGLEWTSYNSEYSDMVKKRNEAKVELDEYDKTIVKLDELTKQRIAEIDTLKTETKETKSLIKAKEEEIELAELMPETTKEELIAKNQKVKALKDELNALQNLGIEKEKEKSKEPKITEKSALETELKNLENAYKERLLIIDLNENKEWETETEHRNLLLAAEESYLTRRIDLLSRFHTSNRKLDAEANSQMLESKLKLNENSRKQDELLIKSVDETKKKAMKIVQSLYDKEASDLKIQYETRQITKEQYDAKMIALEYNTALARMEIAQSCATKIREIEFQNEDIRIKAVEEFDEERIKAERETLAKLSALKKNYYENDLSLLEKYGKISIEEEKEKELARIDALRNNKTQDADGNIVDDPLISAEAAEIAKAAIVKKYEDEKLKVRQEYGIAKIDELYRSELEALELKHEKEMLSEDEYEQAKLQLKLKYAQQYAQQAEQLISAGADAVKAIEEAETAQVSAEYTKRQSALTEQYNQGVISQEEYNAQKEQLDYEEKVKELEIQKKYADVNFAMQAAQIVATTAQGIITAWATSMQLGPILGPIMAAAMTALLGITSTAQLAKAKAERDRVKAMTIESPGGGSGAAPKTGQIKLKEGFAEGGYNREEDLSSGGYTGPGGKYEVAGYVPVHHGEYVIAKEELQQPEIMNMARAVERVRRKRTAKNPAPEGFAEGGSNTSGGRDAGAFTIDGKTSERIAAVLEKLENGDVVLQTNYGITELEAEQRRKMQLESKFTKK